MFLLAKYNVQTDIYFPMVKRGVVDLAVTADWTPAAADCKVSKDGGATANSTNAVAIAAGTSWKLTLTATELSAKWVTIQIVDAATKAVEDQFITILTYGNASAFFIAPDFQDAVRFGLTALPNANAEAAGGLYTRGSGAGQINQDANGRVDANAKAWAGGAIPAPITTGVPLVDWTPSPAELTGTATASAAGTITLAAAASTTANFYNGMIILITSGTGKGQCRIISAYSTGRVATVTPAWTTTPASTATYIIFPIGMADLETLLVSNSGTGAAVTAATAGILDANAKRYNNQVAVTDTQNLPSVNVTDWRDKGVPAANADGVPLVDVNRWQATAVAQAMDGGFIQSLPSVLWQTAQAGGSATSIKLHSGASAVTDFYKGGWFYLTVGAGVGQIGYCTAYNGSTKVATIAPAWTTTPDATTNFVFMPRSQVDLGYWNEVAANALISGRVDANAQVVGDKTGYSIGSNGLDSGALTAAAKNAIADSMLDRNMTTGTDSGTDSTAVRTVRQALRILRNKVSISGGVLTCNKEDDSTSSWTAAITTTAGNPISTVDPT